MGNNSQAQSNERKRVFWIDSDIHSYSNQSFYDEYLNIKYNVNRFTSIHDGIQSLKKTKKFTSVIIIISGRLYIDFYKELSSTKNRLKNSIIIIVFFKKKKLFYTKP